MYLYGRLSNFVDTDADPNIVKELGDVYKRDIQHERHGVLVLDPARIISFRTDAQLRGGYQDGNELRQILMRIPRMRLNANVLDHQLHRQELFWPDCAPLRLFYWGTRYFCHKGRELVRFAELNTGTGIWTSDSMCADGEFGPLDAVALYGDPL